MASLTLGAGETKERHRWDASIKVYARKNKKKHHSSSTKDGQTMSDCDAAINGKGSETNGIDATATSRGKAPSSSNGDATVSDSGDVSVVSNRDTATANSGDATEPKNGDTVTTVNSNVVVDVVATIGQVAVVDRCDALVADSGDTAVADKGHTAVADNSYTVVTDVSDAVVVDDGDTAMNDNCDPAMADNGDEAIVTKADDDDDDDAETAIIDKCCDVAAREIGDAVAGNRGSAVTGIDDKVVAENGDTVIASHGDKEVNCGTEIGTDNDNAIVENDESMVIVDEDVPQQPESPDTEDMNSLNQELQVHQSLSSPNFQEGLQSPQHLQEGGQLPQQPQEVSNLVQQSEHGQLPKRSQVCGGVVQQLEDGQLLQQVEDGHLPQQTQEAVSQLVVGSNDGPNIDRMDACIPDSSIGRKQSGSGKPIATHVGNQVNINLMAARHAKYEVRVLKRKLMGDLDEVRNLVKKLEEKEVRFSSNSVDVGAMEVTGAGTVGMSARDVGYGSVQYPANHSAEKGSVIGPNTDLSLVGVNKARPIRQLTVSVTDHSHGFSDSMEKEKRTPKANQFYRNSDFILGKEKLPPLESNKKLKSSSKKRGGGEKNYGFGMDKQLTKSCGNLLQKLMKHKYGWVFNNPVDVKGLGLHDYYDIIKHPMDLGTVKSRLNKNWYKSPREFAEDVRLTFRNAMSYNPKSQDVHIMAEQLSQLFEQNWVEIDAQYRRRLSYEMDREMGLLTPTSRKVLPAHVSFPIISSPSASLPNRPPIRQEIRTLERSESTTALRHTYNFPIGRVPAPKKPKAKDPDKRDMTFEEKKKLSANLQGLPPEKIESIAQIIKRRNTSVSQKDDELEVDIDGVDTETLWELDRFVTNYKKSLSKRKRRAELALQRAEAARVFQETNRMAPQDEAPMEDENKATSSLPAQGEAQPVNASQSSSSSSSSSGSGSSSSDSDSDSDSSSESSSDEGH